MIQYRYIYKHSIHSIHMEYNQEQVDKCWEDVKEFYKKQRENKDPSLDPEKI